MPINLGVSSLIDYCFIFAFYLSTLLLYSHLGEAINKKTRSFIKRIIFIKIVKIIIFILLIVSYNFLYPGRLVSMLLILSFSYIIYTLAVAFALYKIYSNKGRSGATAESK